MSIHKIEGIVHTRAGLIVLLAATLAPCAHGQQVRDFVFTDEEGHLVLRFAGTVAGELDQEQIDEIVNVQLSTMVHDRLRADIAFETEPADAAWAGPMAARVERHFARAAPAFSGVEAECRSDSCRVVLQHESTWTVGAHQSLMAAAQSAMKAFIDADSASFEPVFMIAAQFQAPDRPYIKIFLQRYSAGTSDTQASGG